MDENGMSEALRDHLRFLGNVEATAAGIREAMNARSDETETLSAAMVAAIPEQTETLIVLATSLQLVIQCILVLEDSPDGPEDLTAEVLAKAIGQILEATAAQEAEKP